MVLKEDTVAHRLQKIAAKNGIKSDRVAIVAKLATPVAAEGSPEAWKRLNESERAIVEQVANGLSNKEIAPVVGSTEDRVKNYLRTIFDKVGVWSRLELAIWYVSHFGVAA
jgi:DNA-binding NarL/FixJ family response regulator